jgi:hypothetical protein
MPLRTQPGDTDLYLRPPEDGEELDPYTVHTYYFGFPYEGG